MDFLTRNANKFRIIFVLLTALITMSFFVFTQPFGDGPDEINRYKVVSYIQNHGTLPAGDEPEIIIDGYGASYAFQPILTYMLEGYILRLFNPLGLSFNTQLIIARYVNVLIGLFAAFYTLKLALLLFKSTKAAYLYALGVILLPQNIFIYTYVNTDGMGLLSCIMIMYALIKGLKTAFDKESVITLGIGIVLCLMSYYNCYGYVLVAILACLAYIFTDGKADRKVLFKKAGIVALISIAGAGWWFIRNMILYNGDIFALTARQECANATGNWYFLEQMAETYKAMGYSLYEMVFKTDYYTLVWKSFIGMFGPMSIPTSHHLYMAYKYLTIVCLVGFIIGIIQALRNKKWPVPDLGKASGIILSLSMFVASVIPVVLALSYSYSWDFQPQGRYYLPLLSILAFVLVYGLETILSAISQLIRRFIASEKAASLTVAFMYHLFYAFFYGSLALSVLIMLNYYNVI